MIEIYKTLANEWKERGIPEIVAREKGLSSYADLKIPKIIVATGFRRTGKTYLLFGLMKKLLNNKTREQVVYINFEDERVPAKTEFLTGLMPALKQLLGGKIEFLFLDEVQNMPGWSKWLRRINDTEKTRLFVTGSSSKMTSREIPTELRGRFLEVNILPLSFREWLLFKGLSAKITSDKTTENGKAEALRALNEFIENGGMPEVALSEKSKAFEIIQSYYNTVVRKDIIERHKIKNEESLKALLLLLLNSTSYTISRTYNTLKSLNFSVGKTTLQRYISYIENSYLMYSLPIFSFKVKDQMQYARKVYFIDNGFINFLSTKFSKGISRLYENAVFLELLRRRKKTDSELCYWRSEAKEEVDFVVTNGRKAMQLIQVCYDISDYETKKREVRALLKASKELKCRNLLIITEDKEGEEKLQGKKIRYIPLWKWLLA